MSSLRILVFASLCALCFGDLSVIYEAEDAHSTQNVIKFEGGARFGEFQDEESQGHLIFTVFAEKDGVFPTTLRFKHNNNVSKSEMLVRVNGLSVASVALKTSYAKEWNEQTEGIPLRQGLNTVVLKNADRFNEVSVDRIAVEGAAPQADRGATLPYIEIEAESASTNGVVIGPDRTYKTLASESSGRKAVQISGSQYIEFTLTAPANAIVVRLSIPDTSDGQGNNGILGVYANNNHLVNVPVTSHYSWVYGNYPYSKIPSQGNAHHFFDEARAMFGSTVPAGAKIRLVAASNFVYTIDLVDFWNVPAPYAQPAGYLSVMTYGADATGSKDSTQAFKSAIDAATSQGKGLYIPQGKFAVNARFTVDKVTIRGAGPWYTIIQALASAGLGFYGNGAPTNSKSVEIYDLAMFGVTNHRVDSDIDGGIGGAFDGNSIFQNILIEHTKVGIWVDGPFQGMHVTGLLIRNTYADGINLHKGVQNIVIEQSNIRNTGDDCFAMWSDAAADAGNTFKFNTVQLPMLANAIGIYGGAGNSATDNIVSDSVTEGCGIQVSNRFGAVPLTGTTTIARNTVLRCGALNGYSSGKNGALWFWASDSAMSGTIEVTDVDIIDSSNSAITFWGLTTLTNTKFSHINISGAPHVVSVWGTSGLTYMEYVTATGITGHDLCTCMGGKFNFQTGSGNTGWSTSDTQCDSSC